MELCALAEFRSKKRIPALSWRHPELGVCLCRCSQPRVGINNRRCFEDQKMLEAISNSKNDDIPPLIAVFDARPKKNAIGISFI